MPFACCVNAELAPRSRITSHVTALIQLTAIIISRLLAYVLKISLNAIYTLWYSLACCVIM